MHQDFERGGGGGGASWRGEKESRFTTWPQKQRTKCLHFWLTIKFYKKIILILTGGGGGKLCPPCPHSLPLPLLTHPWKGKVWIIQEFKTILWCNHMKDCMPFGYFFHCSLVWRSVYVTGRKGGKKREKSGGKRRIYSWAPIHHTISVGF